MKLKKLKQINKKRKKGEFLVRTWVISFLIFSGVFALLFLSSSSLINDYGESGIIDSQYRDNYDKFTNVSEKYRGLFTDISDGSSNALEIIFGDTGVFRAFFDVIHMTFASVNTLSALTTSFITDFGVPYGVASVIFPLAIAILMVFLIFAIISSVNRGAKL